MTPDAHRICILTPAHVSLNPRTVKEADALAAAGYDVQVIAGNYSLWARESDKAFVDHDWTIVRSIPVGPHAPLSFRLAQFLTQRIAKFAVKLGAREARVIYAAWHPITPYLIRAALQHPADLYIAHYPAALPAAALAAKRYGAAFAYDAEDFHHGDEPDSHQHEAHRIMVQKIEGDLLPRCAYMTAAAPCAAAAYVEHYGISLPTVVLNVFPRSQAPPRATSVGTGHHHPSLYWFSQTIGANRGLECALRAIAISQSRPHLYLRGSPAPGFIDKLKRLAAEVGAQDRLHMLPRAAPQELERLASAYDLGLCGEPGNTRNRKCSLTNKMFSFLLAGVPIVASDVPSHVDVAPSFGDAIRLFKADDPEDLARALDHYLLRPEIFARARAEAFRLGQTRYNWDVEQQALLDCVAKVLKPPASRLKSLQEA